MFPCRRRKAAAAKIAAINARIEPYAVWHPHFSLAEQMAARAALVQTMSLLEALPTHRRQSERRCRFDYFIELLWLRQELCNGDFRNACNELQKLIHFNDIGQEWVRNNVLALLRTYIEEE